MCAMGGEGRCLSGTGNWCIYMPNLLDREEAKQFGEAIVKAAEELPRKALEEAD